MFNRVTLIGRLGQDPQIRYVGENAVCNIRVATTKTWRDKDKLQQERTDWHTVVVWGKSAQYVADFSQKGSLIFIDGELQTRNWDDKDGVKHYATEVVVGFGGRVTIMDKFKNEATEKAAGKTEEDVPF